MCGAPIIHEQEKQQTVDSFDGGRASRAMSSQSKESSALNPLADFMEEDDRDFESGSDEVYDKDNEDFDFDFNGDDQDAESEVFRGGDEDEEEDFSLEDEFGEEFDDDWNDTDEPLQDKPVFSQPEPEEAGQKRDAVQRIPSQVKNDINGRAPQTDMKPKVSSYQASSVRDSEQVEDKIIFGEQEKGVLRGWIVNIDGKGQSLELRTGKVLITSATLRKENEIVIEDDSVSVPHAMLHIGQGKDIQVFDLVSERGTFIERKGLKEKVENNAFVKDRDYLIFGNVKLLVVLI
ncbi:MAG: FHA domain-containing protein [Deltaproteobacteria bacterium]|nr:FHA domain-containing protein [Deltaproteobacteria bacterium]MCX7952720.1 FHA domain-containing protein [Deltaproteobacteria bacterium]